MHKFFIYTNFCGLCILLLFSYTFADDMFDFVCWKRNLIDVEIADFHYGSDGFNVVVACRHKYGIADFYAFIVRQIAIFFLAEIKSHAAHYIFGFSAFCLVIIEYIAWIMWFYRLRQGFYKIIKPFRKTGFVKRAGNRVCRLVFVIGGSNGLNDSVLHRADFRLSFSKLTFSHQIFRIMLLEQIYRAFKIMNNEPYHK